MKLVFLAWIFGPGCASSKDSNLELGECTLDAGYADPSPQALSALNVSNCYRELMGLKPGSLDPKLDKASLAHAKYMSGEDAIGHQETIGRPGFTGEWVWDRIVEAGYDYRPGTMVLEVVSEGHEPVEAVDSWMNSVYHRKPFTLPAWNAVGFGHSGAYSSMAFSAERPGGIRMAVIYPANGQVGVNPRFDSDSEMPDPAPDHGVVGAPITVTVSDEAIIGPDSNPYALQLVEAELRRVDGDVVSILTSDPTQDGELKQMAVMLPLDPLEPETQYVATVTVEWSGRTEVLATSFTTAPPP